MPDFKNLKTGEIKHLSRVTCFIKNGVVAHKDEYGAELVDEDGIAFKDVTEFGGFCTNVSRFNSLPDAKKKEILKKRSKNMAFQQNREDSERKKEIDSHSILPPSLQEKKKDFDVKRRHYGM
jgi:hypothetical protein